MIRHHSVTKTQLFLFILPLLLSSCIPGSYKKSTNPEFSFGVLTDVQYCDCEPRNDRYYRNALAKFEESVRELNSKDLAFTIQLGDIIEKDFASFDRVLPIYEQLVMPKYHVLGNHEFSVSQEKKSAVLDKIGLENPYYDMSVKGWRFVILDGNDISTYRVPKNSEAYRSAKARFEELQDRGLPNAQKFNGALGDQQMSWLRNTLNQACTAGEKVILFCHHPVFPRNTNTLWNDTEVMNLIESHDCVVAYINGHYHPGNYQKKNGIHYLTLQGMVDTVDKNAYAIIEIYQNRLEVIGYGREPSRTLYFPSK
ncbi:metallophosphoesterase [candidate division KSB1 bacterium]|nr:metallophosphoesterase [candidate division KSB1 bacterium]